jgi:hypothetical protein
MAMTSMDDSFNEAGVNIGADLIQLEFFVMHNLKLNRKEKQSLI